MLSRAIAVLASLGVAAELASAGTFSRSATTVQLMCIGMKCAPVADVSSPDGRSEIRRTFTPLSEHRLSIPVKIPKLTIVTPRGQWDVPPDEASDPWIDMDVLWSPDSEFVVLTGHTSSYTESLRVFAITESGPKQLDSVLQPAQDMERRLQPYCARYVGKLSCMPNLHEKDFNYAAIAWAGRHRLVIMSEVPCDTRWGGIMCQVMGYEVDLPSGTVIQSLTAREFKKKWQHAMAWTFRIPEPPGWQN